MVNHGSHHKNMEYKLWRGGTPKMCGSQDATINNKSKEQIEVMDRKDI